MKRNRSAGGSPPPTSPAFQAVAGTGSSSSSFSVQTSANVTAFNDQLYLAVIEGSTGNVSCASVTGLGLTWSLAASESNNRGIAVYWAIGTTTGNTVVNAFCSTSQNYEIAVLRYSSVDTGMPIGATSTRDSLYTPGTVWSSSNLATTDLNSIIVGAVTGNSTGHTPGAGYTERHESSRKAVVEKAVASISSQNPSGTLGLSSDWAAVAVEIRGSTGSATTRKLFFTSSPEFFDTAECGLFTVQRRTPYGSTGATDSVDTVIQLSDTGSGTFYTDSNCSSSATQITMAAASTSANFYYKNTTAENSIVIADGGTVASATIQMVVRDNSRILVQEIHNRNGALGTSYDTTADVTAVNNELYLVSIVTSGTISSVTGLGLTWTLVTSQAGPSDTFYLYKAQGTTTGNGKVNVSFSAMASVTFQVFRFSGVHATAPLGASQTNRVDSAVTSWSTSPITTTVSNSLILNLTDFDGMLYSDPLSPSAGYTAVYFNYSIYTMEKLVPTPTLTTIGGSILSGSYAYRSISVEIKPP